MSESEGEASIDGRLTTSECGVLSRKASLEEATAYRSSDTPREQALTEGLLKPNNCATRASDRQFIGGEARRALRGEGATRADSKTSEARLRGRLDRLMPVEGATRAPLIARRQ